MKKTAAPKHSKRRNGEDGIALLIALLFVVLLTVLVVEFVYETQVEATHTAGHQRSTEAMLTAKSAVAMAMSILEADMYQQAGVPQGTPQNLGGAPTQNFGEGYDGFDEYWAQGVPFQERNEAVMQCSITDEFGKLNLNALINLQTGQEQPILIEALRILFETRAIDLDPVDAILDWIDIDESPRPGGVESEYYQSLEVPYTSRNGPMASIEELLLIPGITPDAYFGDPLNDLAPLSDLLTVHGDRFGDINLNTAPWELLDALGIAIGQTGLADIVIAEREQQPFLVAEDYVNRGVLPKDPLPMEVPQQTNDETGANPNVLPVLRTVPATVGSKCFRLRGHGIAGTTKVRIDAYVWRDPQGLDGLFRVIDWRVQQ
jgi:general secretion pathway protein K